MNASTKKRTDGNEQRRSMPPLLVRSFFFIFSFSFHVLSHGTRLSISTGLSHCPTSQWEDMDTDMDEEVSKELVSEDQKQGPAAAVVSHPRTCHPLLVFSLHEAEFLPPE
jgi:hypothetical protein